MAEEVRDASVSIPRVMMASWIFNYITIFIALVTIAYHMPDIDAALKDPTEYPVIYVIRESMSLPWQNVVLIVILLLLIFGNLSYLASVTRDLFAFARDQGLPFSNWIAKVDPKRNIPTNACITTGTTTALLSLIYIGSPVAFYAVISLSTVAILQCYCFSIGCLLWRRIAHPETIPSAQFSLAHGVFLSILLRSSFRSGVSSGASGLRSTQLLLQDSIGHRPSLARLPFCPLCIISWVGARSTMVLLFWSRDAKLARNKVRHIVSC